MGRITIRTVHEAQCNVCGEIKRSPHHSVAESWADNHDCQNGMQYSSVFDKNEAAYDPHRSRQQKRIQ